MPAHRAAPSRLACMRTMRVLQSYLDGTLADLPARRVAEHLEECRRCGLEASVYVEIKGALSRHDRGVDPQALDRLRQFGELLSSGEQPVGD
ncbi:MAG: zf-HC2 domain-containing protein [Actinomycetota bacterium]|nr:zf-HC2 domain-containing protein [Actinomycetota bacterium]